MKKLFSITLLALALIGSTLFTACGSSSKNSTPGTTTTAAKQLDPQGNWLFVLTDTNGNTLTWGQQLYELNPPAVTSNSGGAWFGSFNNGNTNILTANVAGSVSGTNTINYTLTSGSGCGEQYATSGGTLVMTGTIADSQTSTSGTWNTADGIQGVCPYIPSQIWSFPAGDSGTWTAQLLAPVTGTYNGTFTGNGTSLGISMSATENTSQTSPNMGALSGTITISNSPCFSANSPLTIDSSQSVHVGEELLLQTQPDVNNQIVSIQTGDGGNSGIVGVDPNTGNITVATLYVTNGACNGQSFSGSLSQ